MDWHQARPTVTLADNAPPQLIALIHAEEEFQWGSYSREARGTEHLRFIAPAQKIFEEHGVKPIYAVDHPVASSPLTTDTIASWVADGKADVGCHLHPWVNPPHRELTAVDQTYPGNLPVEEEREKLSLLTDLINDTFGRRPMSYLAGRYGFGPNTARLLVDLGYKVDFSPAPAYSYSRDGGPDYTDMSSRPFWNGQCRDLLHLPHCGGYLGLLTHRGQRLIRSRQDSFLDGWQQRLALARRHRLSPESRDFRIMRDLTLVLHNSGQQVFVLAFHSPSLMPGGTPYGVDKASCQATLDSLEQYLGWFTGTLGGVGSTAEAIHEMARSCQKTD